MLDSRTKRHVLKILFCSLVILVASKLLQAVELKDLMSPDAKVTKVAGDFGLTQGLAYSPDRVLFFSDAENDRILKLLPDGSTTDILKPAGKMDGLTFDRRGILYACQLESFRFVRMNLKKDNELIVLSAGYMSSARRKLSDTALDAHGGLYFHTATLGVNYLYADGTLTTAVDDSSMEFPRGILVSSDGRYVYVGEISKRMVFRYPVLAPANLTLGKVIFTGDKKLDGSGPRGMAQDVHGNLYIAYDGITVVDPDGNLIGRIPVAEKATDCLFGGKTGKTLYITAGSSLYSIPMKVSGPGWPATGPEGMKVGPLTMRIPGSWNLQPPRSQMRLAEFGIPASGGDSEPAEVAVFYFGRKGAGGTEANVRRWVDQFAPEGRRYKAYRGKASTGDYVLVDLQGTYNRPEGPPVRRTIKAMPGFRVVNVMAQTESGSYFFKLAGPQATVTAALAGFRNSFGGEAKTEKPFEPQKGKS